MGSRRRLFAGIEIDEPTRALCASLAARLQSQGFAGRFEDAEKMHVTLAFLGWVDAERTAELGQALQDAAASIPCFDLTFDKMGAFPSERNPHVVWAGAREQRAFGETANAVRTAFERLGFSFEKAAVAHVTIARVKAARVHLPLLDVPPQQMRVRALTLFESLPAARTTRYQIVARAPLRGA